MTRIDTHFAVMFADVSGSTRLYETLGDKDAKALIGNVVDRMSTITRDHGGIVIKTIGDEIMSRFPSADAGIHAACAIQEAMEASPPVRPGTKVAVRIGLHWGPALLEGGDVSGDAANIAARMAGIAKARQIITTEDTVKNLSSALAEKARMFDRASVKGKVAEIVIHEVVWEEKEDVTTIVSMHTGGNTGATPTTAPLIIRCGKIEKLFRSDAGVFVLGRADDCNLTVPSTLASRQHARIEFRRGKYILIDQSTNGTWVRTQDGKDVYLRREELPLWGDGLISLGEEVQPDNPALIHFKTPL